MAGIVSIKAFASLNPNSLCEDYVHTYEMQCSPQNFEIGGAGVGVEAKALVLNPVPIPHECHYCAIDCCVLACV